MRALIATLTLLLSNAVSAQEAPQTYTAALCFTGIDHCAPCRQLEQVWGQPNVVAGVTRMGVARLTLDSATAGAGQHFRAWGVSSVPTTVLVQMDTETGEVLQIYRRHSGSMSAQSLLAFLTVADTPESP